MTTRTRADLRRQGYLVAGLILAALAGQLPARQSGNQGYTPTNGFGGYPASNAYATGPVTGPFTGAVSPAGCTTCASTPAAASTHPGHKTHCPPPYYHVMEGPPCLKWKKGCPRPVCDPCQLPHFGYYQTCWSPWPFPPDWRHCPYPTASDLLPPPAVPPYTPKLNAERDFDPDQVKTATPDAKKKAEEEDERDVPAGTKKPEQLPRPNVEKGKVDASPVGPTNVRLVYPE